MTLCELFEGGEMEISNIRQKVGQMLKEYLDGTVGYKELDDKAWTLALNLGDQSIESALHAAQHFEHDAEIHLKDPEYEMMQRRQLEEFAQLLLEGKALPGCEIEFYKPRFFIPSFFSFFRRRKKEK